MMIYQAEQSPESRSIVVDGDCLEEKRNSKSKENSDSIRRNIGVTNLEKINITTVAAERR